MAEYGEWTRKGATLSDNTAKKEYGVDRDFIIEGIRAGHLEFRKGSMQGNPYIKVLRSQLEQSIAKEKGTDYLIRNKTQTELRTVKREISTLKKGLKDLQSRKTVLETKLKEIVPEHPKAQEKCGKIDE